MFLSDKKDSSGVATCKIECIGRTPTPSPPTTTSTRATTTITTTTIATTNTPTPSPPTTTTTTTGKDPLIITSSQVVNVSYWNTDFVKVLAIGGGGGLFAGKA